MGLFTAQIERVKKNVGGLTPTNSSIVDKGQYRDEYRKYVIDTQESGNEPLSFDEWVKQSK